MEISAFPFLSGRHALLEGCGSGGELADVAVRLGQSYGWQEEVHQQQDHEAAEHRKHPVISVRSSSVRRPCLPTAFPGGELGGGACHGVGCSVRLRIMSMYIFQMVLCKKLRSQGMLSSQITTFRSYWIGGRLIRDRFRGGRPWVSGDGTCTVTASLGED